MTDEQYPPPGAPPPGAGPSPSGPGQRWVPAGPPGPAVPPGAGPPHLPPYRPGPPPGMVGAAHKPGAIPLHPLGLGQFYDGAFRIIRFNPKATVGAAAIVTSVAMLLPVIAAAVLTFTVGLSDGWSGDLETSSSTSDELGASDVVWLLTFLGGILLAQVGTFVVTALVCHVTLAAATGRRLTLSEAWSATHGQRWRVIGLLCVLNAGFVAAIALWIVSVVVVAVGTDSAVAAVAYGLLSGVGFVFALLWGWIRLYYFAVPALMLEGLGIFAAIGRGYRLTRDQFWRTLGIALLTVLITGVAGQILGFPISILGQIGILAAPAEYGALILSLMVALSLVLTQAFTAPFTSAVSSLQYIDQRMRKEAFDVELMRMAGVFEA